MDAVLECCCGLDVHRDEIVACILKGPLATLIVSVSEHQAYPKGDDTD